MHLQVTWNSRNTLLNVAKDEYFNNCSKTAHYAQKYLFNCFIVFLSYYPLKLLPVKPPGCSSLLFAKAQVMPIFQTTFPGFP